MRKRTQKMKVKIITILSVFLMAGYVHAIGFGDIVGGLTGGDGPDLSGSQDTLTASLNKSLTDLQKNLDPINNKISELEAKKNDLNNNIQNQISLISQNTKKSEEISQKTS